MPLQLALGFLLSGDGEWALVGGARFSHRPRPRDIVVRSFDHRTCRQRLRHFRRLAEDAARYHYDDPASDRALLSHRAWPTGRYRGLRTLRDQVRSSDRRASWLLRASDRGRHCHLAYRF